MEDQMLVPRWDRAPSTSSQEDLPEPPSDCELGEIRHELPTPPQDEELQLLVGEHHDLPPPPPEVFEPLMTEDLPIPPLDSDSDAPPPPLPPSSASVPPLMEQNAKTTDSETEISDNSLLPAELPLESTELVKSNHKWLLWKSHLFLKEHVKTALKYFLQAKTNIDTQLKNLWRWPCHLSQIQVYVHQNRIFLLLLPSSSWMNSQL
jgi:hypothetical protein